MDDAQPISPRPDLVERDDAAQRAALVDRCRAVLEVLPTGSAFSHLTAARLHGLPRSYAMDADERLHVMRPIVRQRVRQPDVVGHRALHVREIVIIDGVPTVGLADTWADLGELIGAGRPVGLDDSIVVGDAVATRIGSVAPLRQALLRRVRPRGKRTLIEALELIRVGSASPGETLSRIMLVRSRLPEPAPNRPIYSTQVPGLLLGVGDHVWHIERPGPLADIKVVGEYQGAAFHSSPAQREHDRRRRCGLEDDGWVYEEIWNGDMTGSAARQSTVCRFARALAVPVEELDLSGCEPRFFSRHAMDQAILRADRRRRRSA